MYKRVIGWREKKVIMVMRPRDREDKKRVWGKGMNISAKVGEYNRLIETLTLIDM